MEEIYEVREIEGKNLGCVALRDIKKGETILKEKPQITGFGHELSPSTIRELSEAFKKMSKSEQKEYMNLHDKYEDLSSLSVELRLILGCRSQMISRISGGNEKHDKIFKICDTNVFANGLGIKSARFNHSCQPNSVSVVMPEGHFEIAAISKIKAGQEITISYQKGYFGMQKKKKRQEIMLKDCHFICSCSLCQEDDNNDTFEELCNEIEKLREEKKAAAETLMALSYPAFKSKREVEIYKELFTKGRAKKVQPLCLFEILDKGFDAATQGYLNNKTEYFKLEAKNFAKAADKFEKCLGSKVVTVGYPDRWKQKYQNFEFWLQKYTRGIINY